MAGRNIILQPNQILFKEGDLSDGMYVVRTGELAILMNKNGAEVELARIKDGALVGEMALFDQKPRSASVKAVSRAEVNHITNNEFNGLMKQIPKWLIALMTTLSGRLRNTNERLQKIEAKMSKAESKVPKLYRTLNILNLLWLQYSNKEDKYLSLEKEFVFNYMTMQMLDELEFIEGLIEGLIENKIVELSKNGMNKDILKLTNKVLLTKLINYLAQALKTTPPDSLPLAAIELLEALTKYAEKIPYETISVSIAELTRDLQEDHKYQYTNQWLSHLQLLGQLSSHLKIIEQTPNGLIGIRVTKKEIKEIHVYQSLITDLCHKAARSGSR